MLNNFLNKLRHYKHQFDNREEILFKRRNIRFFKNVKNKYYGKSCVIIGNGPSLKIEDLNKLKAIVTFASNKIYLAFENTKWRPTFYSVVDVVVAKNNIEEIKHLKLKKILSSETLTVFKDDKAFYFNELIVTLDDEKFPFPFSLDASVGLNAGYTVIYNQLQLAFYMGFTTVYLIGVDYNFTIPKETKKDNYYEEVLVNSNEINHFHPDYRKAGETWAKPDLEAQFKAFSKAYQIYTENGRRIYNASRFSKLEIFPKVSFDDIPNIK